MNWKLFLTPTMQMCILRRSIIVSSLLIFGGHLKAEELKSSISGEEAVKSWVKTLQVTASIAIFNLSDSKKFDLQDTNKQNAKTPRGFKEVKILPLKAISAEGGNKYIVFLDKNSDIVGVYLITSGVNSLYQGGWQIRPVEYQEKNKSISVSKILSIGKAGENNVIFLPYGSSIDDLMTSPH